MNAAQMQHWGEGLRLLVEWLATGAFALSGVLEAARKRLDAVGVCVVAFLAAGLRALALWRNWRLPAWQA